MEWISVKDELPINDIDVLINYDAWKEVDVLLIAWVENNVWYTDNDGCMLIQDHVTHWTPLPEPPKN